MSDTGSVQYRPLLPLKPRSQSSSLTCQDVSTAVKVRGLHLTTVDADHSVPPVVAEGGGKAFDVGAEVNEQSYPALTEDGASRYGQLPLLSLEAARPDEGQGVADVLWPNEGVPEAQSHQRDVGLFVLAGQYRAFVHGFQPHAPLRF